MYDIFYFICCCRLLYLSYLRAFRVRVRIRVSTVPFVFGCFSSK